MLNRFPAAQTVLAAFSLLSPFCVPCQTPAEQSKESKAQPENQMKRARSRYYARAEEEIADPMLQGAERDRVLSRRASLRLVVMIRGELEDTPTLGAGIIFGRGQNSLFVVTANHVVRRGSAVARDIKVQLRDNPGLALDARPTSHFDAAADVAVLEVSLQKSKQVDPCSLFMFQLSDGQELKRGDKVYGVGNPQGFAWGMSAAPEVVALLEPDRILFQSSFLSPGHSGGALLDDSGRMVGMIQSDQPPYGVAGRLTGILQKLRNWKYIVELYQRREMELYHHVDFESVLEEAVAAGNLTLVRSLLAACPDVNAENFDGRTPLLIASMNGRLETLRFLLELGADTRATTNSTGQGSVNALELAALHGHAEVVKALLQAGADPKGRGDGPSALHWAVMGGNGEVIKVLGTNPALREAKTPGHGTPLHLAVRDKQLQAVKTLLDLGASVNSRDDQGRTPLHTAVSEGVMEAITMLLQAGADPAAKDKNGNTPLALASRNQVGAIQELLRSRGAK